MKLALILSLFFCVSCLPGRSSLIFEAPIRDLSPQNAEEVNFKTLSEKILVPKCLKCHKGFSEEENVLKHVVDNNPDESPLFDSVKTGRMPKRDMALNSDELEIVRLYIENLDGEVNFDELKAKVLAPKCLNCHKRITDEESLMRWINEDLPEESKLLTTTKSGYMPKNGTPLSAKEMKVIQQYLQQFKR